MAYTLVTGASSGIGMELAKEFAMHGHDLILVARTFSKLEALKKELETTYSVNVEIVAADLSVEKERDRLYSYTQSQGLEVEILVNNAGFGDSNAYLDTAWERQKNMVEDMEKSLICLQQQHFQPVRICLYIMRRRHLFYH